MKEKELIYLALPYTWNGEESFKIANIVAGRLMKEGYIVFSPISHSHPIADYLDPELRYSQEFWMSQDLLILEKCDKMFVVIIGKPENGIKLINESKGCQSELAKARKLNMPVFYYAYNEESNIDIIIKEEAYGQ